MRQYVGEGNFENDFSHYRNAPLSSIDGYEEHIGDKYRFDEPALLPPDTSIWDEVEAVRFPRLDERIQESVYRTSTLTLGNEDLPIFNRRYEIAKMALGNTFSFLVGETGCGKSTQVPQILLDAGFNRVFITQPRRLAARKVYERIRDELAEKIGADEAARKVSFLTRGDREGSPDAPIQVVTDGIEVLRQQEGNLKEGDICLVDEVHEDNENCETIFASSKKAGAENPNLRFMFLSATVDAQDRANFLQEVTHRPVPIMEVEGRQFPIEYREAPNSNGVEQAIGEAAKIIDAIPTEGTDYNRIIVIVPDKTYIESYVQKINDRLPPRVKRQAHITELHAKMSPAAQEAAISHNKNGVSITVSTNVIETSLTIADARVIVDTGYERRKEITQEGAERLPVRVTSQATCRQRGGRAGRVTDGIHILTGLEEKFPFVPYAEREAYSPPAIWASDLTSISIRLAAKDIDVALVDFYHAPAPDVIDRAKYLLHVLGAFNEQHKITELGLQMESYHINVPSARMVAEAANGHYSQLTKAYVAVVAAAKDAGGLRYFAPSAGQRWQAFGTEARNSDRLLDLDIFIASQGMSAEELVEYDLDVQNIERTQEQYRKLSQQMGAHREILVPPTPTEREAVWDCIHAAYLHSMFVHRGSGFYQQIGGSTILRTLSTRTAVTGYPDIVLGDKFQVDTWVGGEKITKDTIEGVTAAKLQTLGRLGTHLTSVRPGEFVWRDGILKQRRSKLLHNMVDLKDDDEIVVDSQTPGVRDAAIAHAIANPLANQRMARSIKKQIEKYHHLADGGLRLFGQAELMKLLFKAAPEGVTDPRQIDYNLGDIMRSQGISFDALLPPERREEIVTNAPDSINVNGVDLQLAYRNGQPFVREKNYSVSDIMNLGDQALLPDGREIMFRVDGKKRSLTWLKKELGVFVYS